MSKPIRILVADDHTIVRSGVRLLLEAEEDMIVIGEASDGEQALKLIEERQPDVVLIDIAMPILDGLEATRQIRSRWPQIQVLVLTMHRSDEYFFEVLKAGASGYILKGAETNDLINAVRAVGKGEVFLHSTMAQKLVQDYINRSASSQSTEPELSPREEEILQYLTEGYTSKEIAAKLVVSPSTIYTHRSNIMTKLGLNSRRDLIQYAKDHGLI